ncbi:fungal-specific transcription factor domain-containing protein [Coprinopsis sp. MPI-PUGE-AT-0042]|nr:fungal-specific transcription factor domain-containing protein [Coprinopsis sp. MPI-PUGE-AT-0042]
MSTSPMAETRSENVSSDSEPSRRVSPRAGSSSAIKRKRLHGACDACRKKKSDSAIRPNNICSNCINCRTQCTHETSRRKVRFKLLAFTHRAARHLQALEDRLKTMEAYLRTAVGHTRSLSASGVPSVAPSPTSPADASPSPSAFQMPSTAAAFQLHESSYTASQSNASSPVAVDENDGSDPDDLAHVTLAERLKNLSFDITENRFFGKSSMFLFAQNCMEFKNERSGTKDGNFARTKRPIFWELRDWERDYLRIKNFDYSFPDHDLLESLLHLYFENVHTIFPVLHRLTFERDVATQLHRRDPSFAATLLLVCAIGSRFSTDPRVYINGDDSSAGWKYISQIPLTSSISFVQTNLYDLQRYALAAMYFQGTSMNQTAWSLAGLGLRLAQDSGLHRRQGIRGRPTKEMELRKRAFWCLVAMDRTMSLLLGRPSALYAEDIDVDYPIQCDDEFWETGETNLSFVQPLGRPSYMAAFICNLRLCDIIGSMLRTLYSTKKYRIIHGLVGENWQMRVVTKLDASLVAWRQSLPPHLHWDPESRNRLFFNQAMFLHSAVAYARIQTHRPLLNSNSLTSASFEICREEAINCSHILEAVCIRGGTINAHVLMAAFASALTLITSLWAQREFVTQEEVTACNTSVESCLSYIRRAENRWHGAARMVDMLTEFRSVRSVHVQGNAPEAPQPTVTPAMVSPPHNPPANGSASHHQGNSLDFTGSSPYSTPSPSIYSQETVNSALSLAELPNDTPFNFDFSNLPPEPWTPAFTDQIDTIFGSDLVLGAGMGEGATTTAWNQAPIAYGIDEWDNYINSLGRSGLS